MGLNYQGHDYGEFRVGTIRGEAALGVGRLIVPFILRLNPTPKEEALRFSDLSAELSVAGKNGAVEYVGRMAPSGAQQKVETTTYSYNANPVFEVILDAGRLDAIERARCGGGLTFSGSFWALAEGQSGSAMIQETFSAVVNQSAWIELLQKMGCAKKTLIEIPALPEQAPKEFAAAMAHFETAHQAMLKGDWRACVGECRDVLEGLSLGLGDADKDDPIFAPLFEKSRDMSKGKRLQVLRRAIKLLTHPARHVAEVNPHLEWTRQDAVTVLSMVAAIAGYSISTSGQKE